MTTLVWAELQFTPICHNGAKDMTILRDESVCVGEITLNLVQILLFKDIYEFKFNRGGLLWQFL